MQGKGIVKFFLVVMVLVTIVQYLFILPTNKVENKAEKYANAMADKAPEAEQKKVFKEYRTKFLDSMSNETVFSIPLLKDFSYQELKSRQLALGLDLKGGMSVVLQVDLREFIKALAKNGKDPTIEKALENATAAQRNTQLDYITLFAQEYKKLPGGTTKLARHFAGSPSFRDQIDYDSDDATVLQLLREKANETVNLTFKRLKDRIDEFGVTQPNVSLDAARDLIIVELPGIDNPERARKMLQATANLEFWEVYRISDRIGNKNYGMLEAFVKADQYLKKAQQGIIDTVEKEEFRLDTVYETIVTTDTAEGTVDSQQVITRIDTIREDENTELGPLLEVLTLNQVSGGQTSYIQAVMGTAKRESDTNN